MSSQVEYVSCRSCFSGFVQDEDGDDRRCSACDSRGVQRCDRCHPSMGWSAAVAVDENGDALCEECRDNARTCETCERQVDREDGHACRVSGVFECNECRDAYEAECRAQFYTNGSERPDSPSYRDAMRSAGRGHLVRA